MGGRREVSIISHGPVTSSDLKHERLFFRDSVSTFLQLVVAFNLNGSLVHFCAGAGEVPSCSRAE